MKRAQRAHLFVLFATLVATLVAVTAWSSPASAAGSVITGVVKDSGDVEQPDVLVEVLPQHGSNVLATATTDGSGQFSVTPPSSGTYDVRFTPPADSGLRSYLATGVSTDSTTPLTVVLKSAAVAVVQGTVRASDGQTLPGV